MYHQKMSETNFKSINYSKMVTKLTISILHSPPDECSAVYVSLICKQIQGKIVKHMKLINRLHSPSNDMYSHKMQMKCK